MINFKPNLPFSVPAELQMVTEQKVKGVLMMLIFIAPRLSLHTAN